MEVFEHDHEALVAADAVQEVDDGLMETETGLGRTEQGGRDDVGDELLRLRHDRGDDAGVRLQRTADDVAVAVVEDRAQ